MHLRIAPARTSPRSLDAPLQILSAGAAVIALVVLAIAPLASHVVAESSRSGVVDLFGFHVSPGRTYLGPWVTGGVLSGVAFMLVALHQGRLTWAGILAGPLFMFGVVYGSNLHGRLEDTSSVWSAAAIPLRDLIGGAMRLPLGFFLGGALSLAWCRLLREPWRDIGDRLAVSATVFIAVGRIGCLLTGCCLGVVCPKWLSPLCPTYPPQTAAFEGQVRIGVLERMSPMSHPVHLLPLYFSLSALVLLAVLIWLLRRDAPAGSGLALFALAYPLVKLGLETLRLAPRPPFLMVAPLVLMFAFGLFVLACLRPANAVGPSG